jgi:hypothetical protein
MRDHECTPVTKKIVVVDSHLQHKLNNLCCIVSGKRKSNAKGKQKVEVKQNHGRKAGELPYGLIRHTDEKGGLPSGLQKKTADGEQLPRGLQEGGKKLKTANKGKKATQ